MTRAAGDRQAWALPKLAGSEPFLDRHDLKDAFQGHSLWQSLRRRLDLARLRSAAHAGAGGTAWPAAVPKRALRHGVALAALVLAQAAPARADALWCALGGDRTTYLSGIKDIAELSRGELRARSSRFVRVVNASHATAFATETRACRGFTGHEKAARALAIYRSTLGGGTVEQVAY